MPAVIPAIAGFAAAGLATTGFTVGVMGMSMMVSAVAVGALAGAVVGGLTAAITGGDIGEGILYGAVGGAVGGALGGYFLGTDFGAVGAGTGNFTPGTGPLSSYAAPEIGKTAAFGTPVLKTGAGGGGLFAGMGETSKLMLAQGGIQAMGGLFGGKDEAYSSTEQGVTQQLSSNEKNTQTKVEGDLEAVRLANAERKYEADLADRQSKEALGFKSTELEKTIAQRQAELNAPYLESAAARERQRQTATDLTLSRQQREAANIDEELLG